MPTATLQRIYRVLGVHGSSFLVSDLVIQELSKRKKERCISECLYQVPKGFYEMFRLDQESLSTFPEEKFEELNTALASVACTIRPLHLCQIDELLMMILTAGDQIPELERIMSETYLSFFSLNSKRWLHHCWLGK